MKPEQIALARELLGLTQAQLGQVLDVHPRTVSKWERGVLATGPRGARPGPRVVPRAR